MKQENLERIFTCKPNEFDLVSVFEKYDKVLWIKHYNKAIVGDTIYFYVGGEYQFKP